MANYANLKATIDANIKANGTEAITGPVLNSVLTAAVNTLGAGYQFMGVATTSTNPGTPDAKVFYIASAPGTYTNFKNSSNVALEVVDGEVAILKYETSWSKEVTGAATAAQLTQLGQEVGDRIAIPNVFGVNEVNEYMYITSSFTIESAGAKYVTYKVYVNAGYYYIRSGINSSSRPELVKYTDNTYSTYDKTIISISSGIVDGIYWLDDGYYALCHNSSFVTADVKFFNIDTIESTLKYINQASIQMAYAAKDVTNYKGINTDGTIFDAAALRLIRIKVDAGIYYINCGINSSTRPEVVRYTDSSYGTVAEIKINSATLPIDGYYSLSAGYYAICNKNTEPLPIIQRVDGLFKVFADEKKTNPQSIDISNPQWAIAGSSSKSSNGITLAAGWSNRVYLRDGFTAAHFKILAKIKTSTTPSFIIGLMPINTQTVNCEYRIDATSIGQYNGSTLVESHTLPFALAGDEWYSVVVTWNQDRMRHTIEIYGQFDEYDSWTPANAVSVDGRPTFYSEQAGTLVESYVISLREFYDIKNARLGIFGHSFVQASTLGSDYAESFANLIGKDLGKERVPIFAAGGDNGEFMKSKMINELPFIKTAEYALVCFGINDIFAGITAASLQSRAENIAAIFAPYRITPIFFTVEPTVPGASLAGAYSGVQASAESYNFWLRGSGFKFVDMAQVFYDVDITTTTPTTANIKTSLFKTDGVHPTIEGHRAIYNRIRMDCPYLF